MKICPKCGVEHNKGGSYCSRSCANSRSWTTEDKLKKSLSNKEFLKNNPSHYSGRVGWKHSDEMKELKRQLSLKDWDKRGRLSEEEKLAKNRAAVNKYNALKISAITPETNFHLIKEIYRLCPSGYDVDHIIPLSRGGTHHQDNLQYLPLSENRRKGNGAKYDMSLVIKWQDVIPRNPSKVHGLDC